MCFYQREMLLRKMKRKVAKKKSYLTLVILLVMHLRKFTNIRKLSHGEAVAIGMVMMTKASEKRWLFS